MAAQSKFGGRPGREPSPGERVHLGFRVTPDLKSQVEAAAAESGRSQSQEAELRLESSFQKQDLRSEVMSLAFGPELGGLLVMIGATLRELGPSAGFQSTMTLEGAQRWLDDPYAFDQAVRAIDRIVEALRPLGEVSPPRTLTSLATVDPTLAAVAEQLGQGFAESMIDAVAGRGVTLSLQKDGAEIADMLGPVAERLAKRRSHSDAR